MTDTDERSTFLLVACGVLLVAVFGACGAMALVYFDQPLVYLQVPWDSGEGQGNTLIPQRLPVDFTSLEQASIWTACISYEYNATTEHTTDDGAPYQRFVGGDNASYDRLFGAMDTSGLEGLSAKMVMDNVATHLCMNRSEDEVGQCRLYSSNQANATTKTVSAGILQHPGYTMLGYNLPFCMLASGSLLLAFLLGNLWIAGLSLGTFAAFCCVLGYAQFPGVWHVVAATVALVGLWTVNLLLALEARGRFHPTFVLAYDLALAVGLAGGGFFVLLFFGLLDDVFESEGGKVAKGDVHQYWVPWAEHVLIATLLCLNMFPVWMLYRVAATTRVVVTFPRVPAAANAGSAWDGSVAGGSVRGGSEYGGGGMDFDQSMYMGGGWAGQEQQQQPPPYMGGGWAGQEDPAMLARPLLQQRPRMGSAGRAPLPYGAGNY